MDLETLLEKIKSYNSAADLELIRRAYFFAAEAHAGQLRVSGDPYIEHPLWIAFILAELELDVTTIVGGLLHDVVEDTEVTLEELEENFGKELAAIVDGVTKLSRIEFKSKEEQQVENLRKMFVATAEDIRVILIKLADRLHNMRTLGFLPQERQIEIAEETLEVFAPLAHRLGMFRMKAELEDIALRFLEPQQYRELASKVAKRAEEREDYLQSVIQLLREKLQEVEIECEIQGRAKHFYSIYKKMMEQEKDFSEIYDLIAIRVLVDNVKDCYGALGIIHTLWKPVPGRFKDYIAMPKVNMYQSLHTTVIGPGGDPLEIQIRTYEMHRTAEYGIAAHWRYKEGTSDKEFDEKLFWLRQLLEWQSDLRDAREFMETLKIDLFTDEVFVFTPKGDVIDLLAGSVPIDFAYRIHTDIGNSCIGAKVNGRIVPLDYQLCNGDIVEVLTSKKAGGPSRDWLKIVKTPQAKAKIRQWFKREKRDENIAKGRETLEKEGKRLGFSPPILLNNDYLLEAAKALSFNTGDDLLAALGYGGMAFKPVFNKLKELYLRDYPQEEGELDLPPRLLDPDRRRSPADVGVGVKGVDNLLIRLARCCNPVPGDPIIGYITRGRGVSVHRANCPNVMKVDNPERVIRVEWEEKHPTYYQVEIQVEAVDRPRLLRDVMESLGETKTNIKGVNARTNKNGIANIDIVLEIKDLEQLKFLMQRLGRVRDVISVDRFNPGFRDNSMS
mgnify:CR=1 FL=1